MAATRLRKAFKYPSEDDDDDDELNEIDEEHQEKLISDLQSQDTRKSTLYRNIFLLIPLCTAGFFLYSLLISATTAHERFTLLLGVTSVLCTAYILVFLPIQAPDWKGKRAVYQAEAEKGPVERYLIYANAAQAGLMLLAAMLSWRQSRHRHSYHEAIPAIIFVLTMFVRQQLAPLDFEELQKARYEYKGA